MGRRGNTLQKAQSTAAALASSSEHAMNAVVCGGVLLSKPRRLSTVFEHTELVPWT